MRLIKILGGLILAMTLALGLASCGGSNSVSGGNGTGSSLSGTGA